MDITINTEFIDYMETLISNEYLLLFFLSMLPITELRLSIPVGIILFKLHWLLVFVICILGNAIVGAFLVYFLGILLGYFNRINIVNRFIKKAGNRAKSKYDRYDQNKRIRDGALVLFVGIPLPGTGAWTGALLSHLIALNKEHSIKSIIYGLFLSGIIMTSISIFFSSWIH